MTVTRKSAHVVFRGGPGKYKANPHKTLPSDTEVCFRNMTKSPLLVWFPGDFLIGSPQTLPDDNETRCFAINPDVPAGVYSYAAQVTATGEFVEGNSPPEIIIDR